MKTDLDTSPNEEVNKKGTDDDSQQNISDKEMNTASAAKSIKKASANKLIEEFEKAQQKDKITDVYVGDTVRVGVRISEGNKERVQPYEGVVIAKRHSGISQTITVRRIFQGVGVERVFMVHSPQVASIKVERRGKVRRAKLFYLRDRVGKATRVKQRFDR